MRFRKICDKEELLIISHAAFMEAEFIGFVDNV